MNSDIGATQVGRRNAAPTDLLRDKGCTGFEDRDKESNGFDSGRHSNYEHRSQREASSRTAFTSDSLPRSSVSGTSAGSHPGVAPDTNRGGLDALAGGGKPFNDAHLAPRAGAEMAEREDVPDSPTGCEVAPLRFGPCPYCGGGHEDIAAQTPPALFRRAHDACGTDAKPGPSRVDPPCPNMMRTSSLYMLTVAASWMQAGELYGTSVFRELQRVFEPEGLYYKHYESFARAASRRAGLTSMRRDGAHALAQYGYVLPPFADPA